MHSFNFVFKKLFLSALFLHPKIPVIHIPKPDQNAVKDNFNLPKNDGKNPERKAQWCIKNPVQGNI